MPFSTVTIRRSRNPGKIDAKTLASFTYSGLVIQNSPYLYYQLDETSGTTAIDSSGQSRNGTYTGTYTLNQSAGLSKEASSAVQFGAGVGYINTNGLPSVSSPAAFTVIVRFCTTSADIGIWDFNDGGSNARSSWSPSLSLTSGKLRFYVFSGSAINLDSPASYNDNLWHTVACRLNPSGMQLFVDGTRVNSNTNTSRQPFNGMWVLGFGNGANCNALLDRFAVFHSAISDSTIALIHQNA